MHRHSLMPLVAVLALASTSAIGQQVALGTGPHKPDCPSIEPDSVQISWDRPCKEGNWLYDTQTGCRMWDWHPDPRDKAVWSGTCPNGRQEGRGILQWYEHGEAIDRFEGTFSNGKREGHGVYQWNATDRFEGSYLNDVPNGQGTASLAGETFSGDWRNGCFRKGTRVVAIGVPRTSCGGVPSASR